MLSFILSIFFYVNPANTSNSFNKSVLLNVRADTLTTDSMRLVTIDKILISGNKKTKEKIIVRELELKAGDTIRVWRLENVLKRDRNRIYNTRLFNSVEVVSTVKDNDKADIQIAVEERWYLFPVIIFELADPNFNVWWRQRNRDLNRLEYGIRFSQKNFRGRNEELRATFQFGFTKRFELMYNVPYIDRSQRNGIRFLSAYSTNKNINYKTFDHITQPLNAEEKLRERLKLSIKWTHRQAFYTTHSVEGTYNYAQIADTVATLNPQYFLNGRTSQRYYSLKYEFRHDYRDIAAYPLKGNIITFSGEKLGITRYEDINQWDFIAEYTKYTDLGKKFYLATQVKGRMSLPQVQPYYNLRALGYRQDFVRGYDLYVIEGQRYFLSKNTLRKRLIEGKLDFQKILPIKQFNKVPFAIYLKTYADFGYVYNQMAYPENQRLLNKFLPGGGIGVDIVTFYDLVVRLEQSINRNGKSSFYFHLKTDIN